MGGIFDGFGRFWKFFEVSNAGSVGMRLILGRLIVIDDIISRYL